MSSAAEKLRAKLAPTGGPSDTAKVFWHPGAEKPKASPEIELPDGLEAEVSEEAKDSDAATEQERKSSGQAARALLLKSGAETQFGAFVLLGNIGGRYAPVHIREEAGTDYIRAVMQAATKKMPPKTEVENLCVDVRNSAREAGRRTTVHQRIARTQEGRVLDLGDKAGNVVIITADGWRLELNTEIAFIRGRSYGALPTPIRAASSRGAFKLLFDWLVSLGTSKSRAPLVVAALVSWMRTANAYPLLLLFGAPGTGKTTAARLIFLLIDPSESLTLPTIKSDAEHVAAAAQHRHILTFDNESKLSAAEQDLFCVCVTGGEVVGRALYTDGDVAILPIHRPVLITAVQPVVTRPDLLSRTIPVEFGERLVRRRDDEIMKAFFQMRPELLGALLELLVLGEQHE